MSEETEVKAKLNIFFELVNNLFVRFQKGSGNKDFSKKLHLSLEVTSVKG